MARNSSREVISGVIEAFNRTGKSFKLEEGDDWYHLYNVKQGSGAERGDAVEFEMEPRESGGTTFFNVKGDLKLLDSDRPQRGGRGGEDEDSPRGSRPSYSRSSGSSGSRPASRSYSGGGGSRQGSGGRSGGYSSGRSGGGGDDARQVSIQRQTAIKAAVDMLAALPPELVAAIKDEGGMEGLVDTLVIDQAKRFVEFFDSGE